MGNRATAYLGFGAEVGDGDAHDPPWVGGTCEGDIEEWWRLETGFDTHRELSPFDASGEWRVPEAERDAAAERYFAAQAAHDAAHPLPVEIYQSGTDEGHSVVVCVPGTVASWDWDVEFVAVSRFVTDPEPQKRAAYDEFCRVYIPELDDPEWLGGAFWG